MATKHLNIIYGKEECVLQIFPGTESEALSQAVKGRFQLGDSDFYLTEPTFNNTVALSTSLPDEFTVILHSGKNPTPVIKEHENTEDDVTDSESDESVSWGGSPEYSEHEDDDQEDVKKDKEDENMQEVIKRRRLSSCSSSKIFSYIPRPPSPPRSRCAHVGKTPIPPPPVARNVILSAKSK